MKDNKIFGHSESNQIYLQQMNYNKRIKYNFDRN